MAAKVLYHWKTPTFKGKSIVDLYTLQKRMPELFAKQYAKYQTSLTRRVLTSTKVPNLDGCLWNGAVQCSTIHPQAILDAKRRYDIPMGAAAGQLHEVSEYFVIPVQRLLDDAAVGKMVHWNFPLPMTPKVKLGMLLNCHQLRGAFGEWNRADYPVLDQAYLDREFCNLSQLPPAAEEQYREWGRAISKGEKPQILTYQGCPHVFVRGEIDIAGLEIIKVQ